MLPAHLSHNGNIEELSDALGAKRRSEHPIGTEASVPKTGPHTFSHDHEDGQIENERAEYIMPACEYAGDCHPALVTGICRPRS